MQKHCNTNEMSFNIYPQSLMQARPYSNRKHIKKLRNITQLPLNLRKVEELSLSVLEASPPDCSAVEVQNVMQHEGLAKSQVPLTSFKGELTSAGDSVQAVGEHQLVAS
jgi:hypothetical protein